jgi:glycosyltransferase involved in cell wall biosynthesis/GT2 family glycosyltransferase
MEGPLEISVVIPTRDRWPVLRRTLESLEAQDLDGVAAETIVVDNGSRDGSLEQAEAWAAAGGPLAARVVREARPGAGAARNAGAREAAADLILFIGDDCRPARPDFVSGHARAHREEPDPRFGVCGHIAWAPEIEPTPVMEWLIETGKMVDHRRAAQAPPGPETFYTGNVSLKRRALEEVGGFDERFAVYGYEDLELAMRLDDRGFRATYRPDLLVYHDHRYELGESLRRMETMGRTARLLNRLHEHRRRPPVEGKGRAKLALGRAAAPLALRLPAPERAPAPLRGPFLQAAHLAAFARGHAADPLPDDPALRGNGLDGRPATRPAVSVVVPYMGTRAEGEALLRSLARLRLREGDEVIVADNTPDGLLAGARSASAAGEAAARAPGGFSPTIVAATAERSSYHARNVGAERASGDWLLFVDADCRPRPSLLDDYFREPVEARCGALAGRVIGAPGQTALIARYARSRDHLSQAAHLRDPYRPYGITANLLVRRTAWEGVGGFLEGLRSGGDADICWRMQDAGWTIGYREPAAVEHVHREGLAPLARQAARYGAALAWMNRRFPGSSPPPKVVRRLARSLAGAAAWTATGRVERALFKAIDAVVVAADSAGYLFGNASPPTENATGPSGNARPPTGNASPPVRNSGGDLVVMTDHFPELSETFVAAEAHALKRAGWRVRVESAGRAWRPNRQAGRGLGARYREDDGIARKAGELAWLAARHPLGCARDLAARRRWRREEAVRPLRSLAPSARRLVRGRERHLHVHFAAGTALDALRLARLLGLTYSVTAHAYDIYRDPANLREKLTRAAFASSGCDYTVRDLRQVAGPAHAERIHRIVMGVDASRFARRAPYPGGRTVIAVGRLIEKKGFADLVRAAAVLERSDPLQRGDPREPRDPLERLILVGDGPLRGELERLIAELGLGERVVLAGPKDPDEVRDLMEGSDLLAAPSVVARDGDRDSMPVVAKEALAMELPVVATDEVGLPELVRPEWGRLVPPRDPEALAAAIAELLALPPEERVAMGRAGRAFVLERCDVDRETARLGALIAAAIGR